MKKAGHEIAFHSKNHPDLVKLLQAKGMETVVTEEIRSNQVQMRKDGFVVAHFAYPFGSHNQQLDATLKRHFKTIRMVCNKTNWHRSLSKQSGEPQVLYGAGIDENSKLTQPALQQLLETAHHTRDCIVLTAHAINSPEHRFQVSTERLRWLAAQARRMNMRFVTISELSN